MSTPLRSPAEAVLLDDLQREAFAYFLQETNPVNGLVPDKTAENWPASIAATGLGLACYPVGVERGLVTRATAIARTLAALRFFAASRQSPEAEATGDHGFYYHFLDMETGLRAHDCEISTVDTALLLAGVLTSAAYFTRASGDEPEIRELADQLYSRVDWRWAQTADGAITQGWQPEAGYIGYTYQGYDEALILYVLGLGAPTLPLAPTSYQAWSSSYEWKRAYGTDYLYAGPLFTHQLSHLWIDFRAIQDAFMRDHGIDYFENSRRATYVQQQYAIDNPLGFAGYGKNAWGITASDGPGPGWRRVHGVDRQFFDYIARGVPFGPDDGTIAPWSVVTSLPFAPEVVLPTIEHLTRSRLRGNHPYGFKSTFNATYRSGRLWRKTWVSPYHFGINEGPMVLMIENYRSGLIWELMRKCPYIVNGLKLAGFQGGWLA